MHMPINVCTRVRHFQKVLYVGIPNGRIFTENMNILKTAKSSVVHGMGWNMTLKMMVACWLNRKKNYAVSTLRLRMTMWLSISESAEHTRGERMKKMFINGEWVEARSGETREIINPYNQAVIATAAEGDKQDAKLAISAAREAFDNKEWAAIPAVERGKIVHKIAGLIERDREELAELESLDTGKTVEESLGDMDDIAGVFRYFAEMADKDGGEIIESPIPHSTSKVVHEPVGVCGQITPWNYPLLQASWKLAPALAAGNTLVMKPSEITPLTSIKVFELMEEAGVPAGVINLVLGPGNSVGAELSENDDVDLISFTGGIETGKRIMRAASSNVKNLALELGGKNPNIVFADADFETAVDQAMNAVFFHAGQICSAGTRLIVEESIHDEFVEALVGRVKQIKLGSGFDD